MRPLRVLAFLMLLSACAAAMSSESAYVLGVDAYKNKNYQEALAQWSKAAARGNVDAMNNAGFLLFYGVGVDKSVDDAIRLWRVAAFAGHPESQLHLGNAYESGAGVEKDLAKAHAWYRCSIESATSGLKGANGETQAAILKNAKASLSKLLPLLGRADRKRGQALAAEYISRYAKPAP